VTNKEMLDMKLRQLQNLLLLKHHSDRLQKDGCHSIMAAKTTFLF